MNYHIINYQNDQLREKFCIDLLVDHIEKSIDVETLYFI